MANESSAKGFNYFFGLINLAAVFCIVWLLWYILMNPNTVMKLYTPMYGFSLIVVFVASIVLIANVFEFGPGFEQRSPYAGAVAKGVIATVVNGPQ